MKASVKKMLKDFAMLVGIIVMSIAVGCMVFVLICRTASMESFEYHDTVKREFEASIDEITRKLQGEGLAVSEPMVDKDIVRRIYKPFGVTYTATYSINGKNVVLIMDYSEYTKIKSISVRYSEKANSIFQLNALENSDVRLLISILDEHYSVSKFSDTFKYFNKEYLIDNYEENKNSDGVCSYSFATHDDYYDVGVGTKTETEYFFSVSQANRESAFEFLIRTRLK